MLNSVNTKFVSLLIFNYSQTFCCQRIFLNNNSLKLDDKCDALRLSKFVVEFQPICFRITWWSHFRQTRNHLIILLEHHTYFIYLLLAVSFYLSLYSLHFYSFNEIGRSNSRNKKSSLSFGLCFDRLSGEKFCSDG